MFEHGLERMRADFHLHTKKDKEFKYAGEENSFINDYISALSAKQISIGLVLSLIITNLMRANIKRCARLVKSKIFLYFQGLN